MGTALALLAAILPVLAAGVPAQAPVSRPQAAPAPTDVVRGPERCEMQRDYWLVLPSRLDADRMRWLVVLVHGFRGRGADILWLRRSLADFDDCLFVAPSFPEGFQLLEERSDRQLIDLFVALRKRYRLHDKLFVCGFSAGAQFGHRFAMAHPELVAGVSANSGGTWGPDLNPAARHIPMSLSCGLDDVARSSIAQPLSRVQGAHRYFCQLAAERFHIKARLWRGVGHATCPKTEALIAECYEQAASFTRQVRAIRAAAAGGRRALARDLIAALVPDRFPDPPGKRLVRAKMNSAQRRSHDVAFGRAGLGGPSRAGSAYWVDDRDENRAGWVDSESARKRRRQVLERYLTGMRRELEAELHR